MNRMRALSPVLALTTLLLGACQGTDKKDSNGGASNPCNLHTIYAGDQNCILPPAPEEGVQLHVGPSSYDDPSIINAQDAQGHYLWLMTPGDERTECYHMNSPNAEKHQFFQSKYRMRDGSHHMIIMASSATTPVVNDAGVDAGTVPTPEGWWGGDQNFCGDLIQATRFGGTQQTVEDVPPGGVIAPEDEDLARFIDAHEPIDVQLHFYNQSDQPRLREVWVNYYYKPDTKPDGTPWTSLGMIGGITMMQAAPAMSTCPVTTASGTVNYPCVKAGESGTVTGNCPASAAITSVHPVRIVSLFGHAHNHNRRFAIWHVNDAAGLRDLIYDSYDGADGPTFYYGTLTKNPVPDPTARVTGAHSGMLLLDTNDRLEWQCDVVNNTNVDFYGKNEVNTDEMCHMFGVVVGLGMPCWIPPASSP